MTTLTGNELFDYLGHLESEVDKRISETNEQSLQYLMHSQMESVIKSEVDFLKYVNSNGTQAVLSISPNGLPSIDSLNPDLEKMCELAENESLFNSIAERFRKGINGKNKGKGGHLYVSVSEDKWNKELSNKSKEILQSQIGFAMSETDDGKLELCIREDVHLQGYDKYSKDFPILIREGKMKYHVVWNRLVNDAEESFYVPNETLVKTGDTDLLRKPRIRLFDDISKKYFFGKKRLPRSLHYANFLAETTSKRVRITKEILDALGRALKQEVNLKGIRRDDLENILAFSEIPYKNDSGKVFKKKELYCIEYTYGYKRVKPLPGIHTIFTLISFERGPIGKIEYGLPFSYKLGSSNKRKLFRGDVSLKISGKIICDREEYDNFERELKKIKMR